MTQAGKNIKKSSAESLKRGEHRQTTLDVTTSKTELEEKIKRLAEFRRMTK